jgi:hypothetical protein
MPQLRNLVKELLVPVGYEAGWALGTVSMVTKLSLFYEAIIMITWRTYKIAIKFCSVSKNRKFCT